MRFWLDILTPKQLFLFTSIARALKNRGHEVLLTARNYEQLGDLLAGLFREWDVKVVGRFGGPGLEEKLRASVERLAKLLDVISGDSFEVAVSSGSVEAARIAYGLGRPHVLVSDSPHSPVNPLTAPLSSRILTPWVIDACEWSRFGVPSSRVMRYRALDPYFWLKDFKMDRCVPGWLGLKRKGYVLLRLPESAAAYLRISDEELLKSLEGLPEVVREAGLKLAVMARYGVQAEAAERILGREDVIVFRRPFPASHVIYYSALFVGGGGTMTQEAALLGVPSVSIYPGKLPTVLKFLVRERLTKHYRNLSAFMKALPRILRGLDKLEEEVAERSKRLWRRMENPEPRVIEWLEGVSG